MRPVCLFGQRLTIQVLEEETQGGPGAEEVLKGIEAFFCAAPLQKTGVALDIGAGCGEFALPFARAFPDWNIWCFEADPLAFDVLQTNIQQLGIKNVRAVLATVEVEEGDLAPEDASDRKPTGLPLQTLPPGLSEAIGDPDRSKGGAGIPAVFAKELNALSPTLARINAPESEAQIVGALADSSIDHFVGQLSSPIPSRLIHTRKARGKSLAYLPIEVGTDLALTRLEEFNELQPGLDVVVAMYNARAFITDCLESLVGAAPEDVNVIVVDDGSTDGCAQVVQEQFGDHPQVRLLSKLNGGCASARNFGRLHSDASHIAFVDADDLVDQDLFADLLELARYTGAEVVQGGFDLFFDQGPNATPGFEESYEQKTGLFSDYPQAELAGFSFCSIPSEVLLVGQPTIWRRVYRRDFLDSSNIWFPEHIRAFDDQLFQLLTLQKAVSVPAVSHVRYHYRQHPDQDIKQGDERFFYALETFRMVVKRGIQEGWGNFQPILRSFINTVNWSWEQLAPSLRPSFVTAAAELWVLLEKTLGEMAISELSEDSFKPPEFSSQIAHFRVKLSDCGTQYSWIYLDSFNMHVPMLKMSGQKLVKEKTVEPEAEPLPSPGDHASRAVSANRSLAHSGISNGDYIVLRTFRRGKPRYLDGITANQSVGLSRTLDFPFTGTRWQVFKSLDGSWVLKNQGQVENCLTVEDGLPVLRSLAGKGLRSSAHWEVFERKGKLGIATKGGQALTLSGNTLKVRELKPEEEPDAIWQIEKHDA